MPNPTKGPRLGGSPTHERIILANLASQLFEHGRITTTETKAKRVRPLAEKLISKAKRGDLHNRRLVLQTITNPGIVHILFTEIAPALEGREGGYTRITRVGHRKGDNAPMAVIEIVTESVEESRQTKAKAAASSKSASATSAPAPKTSKGAKPAAAAAVEDTTEPTNAELESESTAEPTSVELEGESTSEPTNADVRYSGFAGSYVGEEPPAGFDIKGNADSMKFHLPGSQWYDRTIAEVWFDTAESAEAAGFTPAARRTEAADDDES